MTHVIDPKEKQKLEDLIELLGSIKGRHTELVTVLIPAGANINLIQRQLEGEKSTASNIKSASTRKNVISALDMIIREMKGIRQTPPNGLALFCGNISEKEGFPDIQLWNYEPPKPLNVKIYRCDQQFIIEPLKEMVAIDEVYGLIVIDRQQATIGLLEGSQIKVLQKLTSGVPGKVRAGGQCLSPDTLIMKEDGGIVPIKNVHNPMIIITENFNQEKTEEAPIIAKWENEKEVYQITTAYPKLNIRASKDHTFFVRTEKGVIEKVLSEIKEGDYLLMPEKINLNLEEQKIDFKPLIKQEFNMKQVNIPEKLTAGVAKIFGYYLGDGNYELDRISFSEQRKEVAEYYKKLIEECFETEVKIKFRENKGYYQLRAGSRILSQFFRNVFDEKEKTLNASIPLIVLKSPDEIVASFIGGFFDAEGYVSKNRVAFGINNQLLARQVQFVLLRLGIISSINEYDNRKNPYSKKTRYTLAIDDLESLKKFYALIGFASGEKQKKVAGLISIRGNRNKVRQIVVNGREIAQIIHNSGMNTRQFNCPDFFVNKKQMSKEVFKKNILDKIQDSELRRRLELFYLSNLIAVKISSIKSCGFQKTVDIETKNHNFIANGILVHNSSQRFHRITEGLAKEFFRRVAEDMKKIFFDMPKLKGILVGGPIPTKEDFLDEGQLVTKLKEKIIAIKDLGYVDEHGLELLVEASQEEMQEQELVKEKKILERFFETLGKDRKKAAYKEPEVRLALERGAVDVLLISKKFDRDKQKEFEQMAENIGSSIVLIGADHTDGEQFWNLTEGVGAILRFSLD